MAEKLKQGGGAGQLKGGGFRELGRKRSLIGGNSGKTKNRRDPTKQGVLERDGKQEKIGGLRKMQQGGGGRARRQENLNSGEKSPWTYANGRWQTPMVRRHFQESR